ncbi:MAG: SLBB domain-containing protein [Anaerolineae bacterium]
MWSSRRTCVAVVGQGFPTVSSGASGPQNEPIKYVVVNADESETGIQGSPDSREQPHQLIEGALIAAWAIQAAAVYIYLRGEFMDVAHALDKHIEEATRAATAARTSLAAAGPATRLRMWVPVPTSAMRNRAPRKPGRQDGATAHVRPPFPAQKEWRTVWRTDGGQQRQNLANVQRIVINGADEYKKIALRQNGGTKVFCLSGHVSKPGNYELPFGITFRELIFEHGGGMLNDKKVKAICRAVRADYRSDR